MARVGIRCGRCPPTRAIVRCGKAADGPSRRLKIEPLRGASRHGIGLQADPAREARIRPQGRIHVHARSPAMLAPAARRKLAAPGPEARAFARHKQSSGLFVSGLSPLRSLRSDSRGESDHEARCARGRRHCASRASRYSPPRGPIRSLASTMEACHWLNTTSGGAKGCADAPGRAYAVPRSGGRPGRARSAPRDLTWEGVSEWRERSERNELPDRPGRPSTAGQSTRSGDRRIEAPRRIRTALCRAGSGKQ